MDNIKKPIQEVFYTLLSESENVPNFIESPIKLSE